MFNGETVWMPKLITQFAYTDLLETWIRISIHSAEGHVLSLHTCTVYITNST